MQTASTISWGIEIANPIDVAQSSNSNKQMPPLKRSSQIQPKIKKISEKSLAFLSELGVNSQQFKTLFENLPQGVAFYKMIYNQKGKPIDYILLESNKAWDSIRSFKKDRVGQKVTGFNSKINKDQVHWIRTYGKVATTGAPDCFETYCKPEDKWYCYIYSPANFCISIHGYY
jgi:hypothetical protein